jgi:hypothetical protein
MSSILLINPFVTPVPLSNSPQVIASAFAVAPMQGTSAGNNAGNATSFSGSGSGHSGGSDQQSAALVIRDRAKASLTRPADATGTSVVNAQTQDRVEIIPFGANLPKVDMPDPLPTSPFLLRMSEKA